ncbi:hypothetical protein [Coleofasciculus sp. G2-EDA-02]|uniref:hypothetical protein n=1 Tax=Coleofasciculus sp. G2-EDA-02 TaxID=3069529 RepID=UPI003300FFCD
MFRLIERFIQWLGQPPQPPVEQPKGVELSPQPKPEESPLDDVDEQIAEKLNVSKPSPESANPKTLQEQLNFLAQGKLSLWPPHQEYIGSIVINRPLILDGQGATICTNHGPVVSIESDRVSLRNLRIEFTGEVGSRIEDQCAILVKSGQGLQLDNVEVRGSVMGLPEEEGEWNYPESLHLGQLSHGREHDLLLRIIVPVNCTISANISGLAFSPRHLTPGQNEIRLHIDSLPKDTLINGSIFLVSASLKRRITLTAHILALPDEKVPSTQNKIVWQPDNYSSVSVQEERKHREDNEVLSEFISSQTSADVDVPQTDDEVPTEVQPSQPLRKQKIRQNQQPKEGLFPPKQNSPSVNVEPNSDSSVELTQSQIPDLFAQSQNLVQSQPDSLDSGSIPVKEHQIGCAFSIPIPNSDNKTTPEIEEKPSQPQPKVSSVFLDQETAFSQEPSQEAPSSSRSVRSQPINNPLFQQNSTSSMPLDEPDKTGDSSSSSDDSIHTNPRKSQSQDTLDSGKKPESSANKIAPSQSVSGKRKIVHPNTISSIFGGDSEKKQPDEQE